MPALEGAEAPRVVSTASIIKRVNRRLARIGRGAKLCTARRLREHGRHYVVALDSRRVIAAHCRPEQLARELGALEPEECVGGGQ